MGVSSCDTSRDLSPAMGKAGGGSGLGRANSRRGCLNINIRGLEGSPPLDFSCGHGSKMSRTEPACRKGHLHPMPSCCHMRD